jgi:hypothetical protein
VSEPRSGLDERSPAEMPDGRSAAARTCGLKAGVPDVAGTQVVARADALARRGY